MKLGLVLSVALTVVLAASAGAITSVSLDFNGSGNSLADTGFGGAYNLDPANFSVGGGVLTINTADGDTYGNYENDPDSAKNFFFTEIEPLAMTTVEAKVTLTNLSQNFHGGGIWLGTDQDHYIRLAPIHNSYEGGIVVEALRENEDFWPVLGGPGNDIMGRNSPVVASPGGQFSLWLKLVRDGKTATAWYSLDGLVYNQVNGTFDGIALGPADGATVEGNFKVGAYALGGGNATAAFDYFVATSVPEPGSFAVLLTGLAALAGLRPRRR